MTYIASIHALVQRSVFYGLLLSGLLLGSTSCAVGLEGTVGDFRQKTLASAAQHDGPDDIAQFSSYQYDPIKIYYQLADYFHDPAWATGGADYFFHLFKSYSVPNNGAINAIYQNSEGLLMRYRRTGDNEAKTILLENAQKAAFATPYPPEWTESWYSSREIALNLLAKICAELVGLSASDSRMQFYVDQAYEHLNQWFVTRKPYLPNTGPKVGVPVFYVRPFMVAITLQSLILYQERTPTDSAKVLQWAKLACDYIQTKTWLEHDQTWAYTDRDAVPLDNSGNMDPAWDVAGIIAPVFAWVYYKTGETKYRDWADAGFAGMVSRGYWYGPKQFNEGQRWIYDYFEWREGRDRKYGYHTLAVDTAK